ncbi:MAG: translesion DNA synthesis-associated protein ImuA [Salinisphaera sp.]|jgi:protein ImuA|nr:translesion DNA synthesis-associated protein ImuA [Salinisphaera sp.]
MRLQEHDAATDTQATAQVLEARLRRFGVHRASQQASPETWSTGWASLDAVLPGGGYPLGAVTEFLVDKPGSGELSLLLAALKPRLAADIDSRLVFVNPPYRLNAPALDCAGIERARVPVIQCANTAERIWSIEQLAAAGGFVAFVLWDSRIDTPALRRLQLAGEKAACPVFVYRDIRCARQRSPAALRLVVTCHQGHQQLEVLKCRGPAGARVAGLCVDRDLPWRWPAPELGRLRPREADNDGPDNETPGEATTQQPGGPPAREAAVCIADTPGPRIHHSSTQ